MTDEPVTYRIEQARDAIEPDDYAAMLAEAKAEDVYANQAPLPSD